MEKIYSQKFRIEPYQVDFRGKISLFNLGNFLMHVAGMHAHELGFGVKEMQEQKKAWFLTRFRIDLEYFPQQFETIQIQSWISSVGDKFTSRSFLIQNSKGNTIGKAISTWAMVDLLHRKLESLEILRREAYIPPNPPVIIKEPSKVILEKSLNIESEIIPKYSDLDINVHVYSMRYLQWIQDLFPLSLFKQKSIKSILLNYSNEIRYGQKVKCKTAAFDGGNIYHVGLLLGEKESTACSAIISWG